MDLTEYKQALGTFDQDTAQDLAARADWVEKEGLPWLWSELGSIIGRSLKPLSPEHAIRQGLETSERRQTQAHPQSRSNWDKRKIGPGCRPSRLNFRAPHSASVRVRSNSTRREAHARYKNPPCWCRR